MLPTLGYLDPEGYRGFRVYKDLEGLVESLEFRVWGLRLETHGIS